MNEKVLIHYRLLKDVFFSLNSNLNELIKNSHSDFFYFEFDNHSTKDMYDYVNKIICQSKLCVIWLEEIDAIPINPQWLESSLKQSPNCMLIVRENKISNILVKRFPNQVWLSANDNKFPIDLFEKILISYK